MTGEQAILSCGECLTPLPHAFFNTGAHAPCTQCGTTTRIHVFPAHYRSPEEELPADSVDVEGGAACFFHETRPAMVACDACGRFLCRLCDMDMGNQHLCASCLSMTRKQKPLNDYTNKHPRYDRIAFGLATYGILLAPLTLLLSTLITAPAAIYLALRHWREPLSIVPCSRWKMVAAAGFAGLQLIAWAVGCYLLAVKVFTAW